MFLDNVISAEDPVDRVREDSQIVRRRGLHARGRADQDVSLLGKSRVGHFEQNFVCPIVLRFIERVNLLYKLGTRQHSLLNQRAWQDARVCL